LNGETAQDRREFAGDVNWMSATETITGTVNRAAARIEAPAKTSRTPQGLFCMWQGLSFGRWMQLLGQRPPLSWRKSLRIGSITGLSALNSASNLLEHLLYGRTIARTQIEHSPVFILGHWRSGTTLLHNLMTLDPQFTYPNLYQTLFPQNFLLTETVVSALTGPLIPKTRPMDNVAAGWKLPQEDEVALLLMTLLSPYLLLAYNTDREKTDPYLELSDIPSHELELWKQMFLYFLKKLTIKANKPIVLKSPSHTYRVPLLLELFPDAKFVYIRRDPYAVYKSSVHLRRTLFQENSLAIPDESHIEEDALDWMEHCLRRYESTKHLIPAGNLHELRFEDLEADPVGEMHRLYQGLSFSGWERVEPAIRAQLPELQSYKKNKFSTLPADVRHRVFQRLRFAFEEYDYPDQLGDEAA
jgi:omega-hydroxy-beta-dihydromenaquinone-9 sulfotransferase